VHQGGRPDGPDHRLGGDGIQKIEAVPVDDTVARLPCPGHSMDLIPATDQVRDHPGPDEPGRSGHEHAPSEAPHRIRDRRTELVHTAEMLLAVPASRPDPGSTGRQARLPPPAIGHGTIPAMKISVLLPTRNRLDYLRFAIESVRRQQDEDWEIVVSDNCSDDNVGGYVASLGDPRIVFSRFDHPVTDKIPVSRIRRGVRDRGRKRQDCGTT
jgi:hypothetical protein